MYKAVGDQEIKVHRNAIARPPFLQSGVPRPQRALFFHGNARSQAGKIVLSIINELVNLNLVNIMARLEIQGAHCKIERVHKFLQEPRDFCRSHYLKITL